MKIGISRPRALSPGQFLCDPLWTSRIALSEWDLLDLIDVSARQQSAIHKTLASSSHRTILGVSAKYLLSNPEATSERISILLELAEAFVASSVLIRSSREELVAIEQSLSKPLSSIEVWVDCGRELPQTRLLPVIEDPLWHRISTARSSGLFKLHGWHPARWVRYYGPERLQQLARLAAKHRPRVILFAHSMRNEEALRFQELLR